MNGQFLIIITTVGLLMCLPWFYQVYTAIRVYLITKRIIKCMSCSRKNWGAIRNLEYELNKLKNK